MPLSRVQIYSAEDDSMSLNLFVYGEEAGQLSEADVTMTGEQTNRITWEIGLIGTKTI